MKRFVAVLAAVFCLAAASSVYASWVYASSVYASMNSTVSVIVGFKAKADKQAVNSVGGRVKEQFKNFPFVTADLPTDKIDVLKKNKNIDFIEVDGSWSALEQTLPWGIDRVDAEEAHAQGVTGEGIKLGVIDSGAAPHEDLFVLGGWNFIDNTSAYQDDFGHGTHVTGIAAAVNNQIGVIGAAPELEVYELKALDNQGNAKWSTVAKAIDWAISNKLDILNMSFGGNTGSKTVERALRKAYKSGILLIAAAGNQGDAGVTYPAKYDTVIAVGATDIGNNLAAFSSTGPEVEVAAPGVDIISTYLGDTYVGLSGTSMAAPHASGVAALLWSKEPALTNVQVREKLRSSTVDLGAPGLDSYYGYGLLVYR